MLNKALVNVTMMDPFKHLGHEKHLCKLVIADQATCQEIKPLVNNPQYICHVCKRLANKKENLCHPEPLFD